MNLAFTFKVSHRNPQSLSVHKKVLKTMGNYGYTKVKPRETPKPSATKVLTESVTTTS